MGRALMLSLKVSWAGGATLALARALLPKALLMPRALLDPSSGAAPLPGSAPEVEERREKMLAAPPADEPKTEMFPGRWRSRGCGLRCAWAASLR